MSKTEEAVKSILVIRSAPLSRTFEALTRLRQEYSNAKISILVQPEVKDEIERSGLVDKVIVGINPVRYLPRKGPKVLWGLLSNGVKQGRISLFSHLSLVFHLRKKVFDLAAIIYNTEDVSWYGNLRLFTSVIRARERVGVTTENIFQPYGTRDVIFDLIFGLISRPLRLIFLIFRGSNYRRLRLAELYEKRGMIDEAVKMWQHTLRTYKDPYVHSQMLQAMLKSPTIESEDLLKEQKKWAEKYANFHFYNQNYSFKPYIKDQIIRVGYICSFWQSNTIKFQLLPILRHHDRSKFYIFAYSHDEVSPKFETPVDVFRIVRHLNDDQFIQQVRQDRIDILVECTGFSPGHRFVAMALRCAPVQISYLNHTGTSGVPNIDYVLADEIALRKEEEKYFTERVYYLPGSFFCFNFEDEPHPDPGPPPHITNNFVTFGCFGSGGKINNMLIGWWAEILKYVPGSKIYIRNNELTSIDNRHFMENRFQKYGIERDQFIIQGGTDQNGIIESYRSVDISLDTWPYCGGNTIAESLWQNVPVITYRGQRFSSAYGASILSASGCRELVANDPEDYIKKAVDLAQDKKRIKYYRDNLRKMIKEHGFNDAKAFAQKLEKAYIEMLNTVSNAS